MNLNQVHLIGRVTRDPELKMTPGGIYVAKFGLATNNKFKNKAGESIENTQFHNCVAFGYSAENIQRYSGKGCEIYVEGRIEYREWIGKDEQKKYMTEIIVEKFKLGAKPNGGQKIQDSSGGKKDKEEVEYPTEEINPEDIPF